MSSSDLLNKFKKLELDKKKIFLFAIVFLFIVYIDFISLVKLQLRGIKTISSEIIKLKTDMNNLTKDAIIMQDFKNKQIKAGPDTSLKVKKIITQDQMPLFLQDIAALANRNNVKIIKISPSKESRSDEEKIALDLSCDYHHLGSFLNALENAEKFIAVEEIKITSNTSNYFQQNVKLVLKTYVKK